MAKRRRPRRRANSRTSTCYMPLCAVGQPRRYLQLRALCSSSKRGVAAPFPGCDHTASPYKGASYETVLESRESLVTPRQRPFYSRPLLLHEGRAQWLWDHEGRRYLDMFAGIATVSVGHCHPKVVAAMSEQARRLGHTTAIYLHPRYHEYAAKLTATLPAGLSCVYLTNSGSEATELAIHLARVHTGRHEVVSLRNCYHGGTAVANATTAMACYKYPVPSPAGHLHVTNPDVYAGAWGGAHCRDSPVQTSRSCECVAGQCQAGDNYVREFRELYECSLAADGKIAAFTAESIQGHGVQPDIVVMAKGIGNGFPLGAVVTRPRVAQALAKASYFNTFGGNPVACAVGSAVLDIIDEENLRQNALTVGTHLLNNLASLMKDFPALVGDVRGKGLMIGVELVVDPETKEPLPAAAVAQIFEDVKDAGVLIGKGGVRGNVFRMKPPLCVTKEDADYTVEALRSALKKYESTRK
ncbi:alanine--glyoxylate aminotransferase 2, mitochondrial isoform X3 [Phymastichus coffea]|uniref:alanine--glyoxylate aminotransferase 2, mitochondrial isoform X3 n=1 Tax=Phymastichus coffea TaxID=108790 RepID=UPI00273CD495|nr:alanine--glyoxylate aminotransferase 2, mitochondrial isoform X3 [Phymastichus coffea]